MKRLTTRRQQLQVGTEDQELGEPARCLHDVLEVVEENDELSLGDVRVELVLRAEYLCSCRKHERRIAKRGKRHPPNAVRERVRGEPSRLGREACLPGTSGAGEREQANILACEQCRHFGELALAPEERSGGNGEVRQVERSELRVLGVADLVKPLRRGQVLQPMLAEVAEVRIEKRRRRRRDKYLPSMAGSGNPRRSMNVLPDIALLGHERRARVKADPYADRARGEGVNQLGCSGKRSRRGREGDEEGVPLRIDLHPAVGDECLAQNAAMLRERVRVVLRTDLVQQPCRTFHIREQERHRAGREITPHRRHHAAEKGLCITRRVGCGRSRQSTRFQAARPTHL